MEKVLDLYVSGEAHCLPLISRTNIPDRLELKIERAVQYSGDAGLAQTLASAAGDRGAHLATIKQIKQELGTIAAGLNLSSLPARHIRKHHQINCSHKPRV